MDVFEKERVGDIAQILFKENVEILTAIAHLHEKIDALDKSNKKFLMTATMGKLELLEKENMKLKMGIITLLDQIDALMLAVNSSNAKNLKKGMDSYYRNLLSIIDGLGLKTIRAVEREPFNSMEQECTEVVHLADYENNVVVALHQKGYMDKSNCNILRYAKVTVNQQERKDL